MAFINMIQYRLMTNSRTRAKINEEMAMNVWVNMHALYEMYASRIQFVSVWSKLFTWILKFYLYVCRTLFILSALFFPRLQRFPESLTVNEVSARSHLYMASLSMHLSWGAIAAAIAKGTISLLQYTVLTVAENCYYNCRVATAQGIWFLLFPDRENTGNFVLTQGKIC